MVDSVPGSNGFESRCGRYVSLVHTYAVTRIVQIRGIMTTKTYNRFAPHQKTFEKKNDQYVYGQKNPFYLTLIYTNISTLYGAKSIIIVMGSWKNHTFSNCIHYLIHHMSDLFLHHCYHARLQACWTCPSALWRTTATYPIPGTA